MGFLNLTKWQKYLALAEQNENWQRNEIKSGFVSWFCFQAFSNAILAEQFDTKAWHISLAEQNWRTWPPL